MRLPLGLAIAACMIVAGAVGAARAQPRAQAERLELPAFLPSYFRPVFDLGREALRLADHGTKDNVDRYQYVSEDGVIGLSVESFPCDGPMCDTVFRNALTALNQRLTQAGGRFRAVEPAELRAEWRSGGAETASVVFRMPASLLFWTVTARQPRELDLDARFAMIRQHVHRLRYEQARSDNVLLGRWHGALRALAQQLLRDGRQDEALTVLRDLIATAPTDYEAQLDLAEATTDRAVALGSARIVAANAEDPALLARAARVLGRAEPSLADLPPLPAQPRGLQVILIPLPPCDVRLLSEAAAIYQTITDVPVRLARLTSDWELGVPDRIADQKAIQQALIQQLGPAASFEGWTLPRYAEALMASVRGKDALARFTMQAFVDRLGSRPGQYRVDPLVTRLLEQLAPRRSDDRRTMYVGVTAANIYDGDANFLFSQYDSRQGGASILSYAMMLATTLNEPYPSRKRLAERLAKELVPASLNGLGIPRPADPTDPYSYSSGVERLAQKSLTLSEPTRAALDRFR